MTIDNKYLLEEISRIDRSIEDNVLALGKESDKEITKLISEEIDNLQKQKTQLMETLNSMDNDKYPVIDNSSGSNKNPDNNIDPNTANLEIRAGTGGMKLDFLLPIFTECITDSVRRIIGNSLKFLDLKIPQVG